ncbi:uncharacterized protein LOC117695937 [Arvicanthis niloticus]|uniref:uncharacterized protein LOC117695937 n=1 Tax=Arvicanthis niloticus TaxID=61156 RepID=UPI001486AE8B|nr:uncharacterized protein LOC117695937 [Arvicanthis niloticus]
MERNTQKMRSGASNPCQRITHEDLCNLLKRLQKLMNRLGYGSSRKRPREQPAIASLSSQRGMLNVQTNYEQNTVPVFNTYEEYHKTVLQSFENISIVLNIEGKVVFVSQNVTPLLGYLPEDIIGTSLLNLVHDEQKDDISEKIILNLPLANIVGRLIEFCCYIRKGNVGQSGQDTYCYRTMYQGRYIYEYVKFILYLQDSYDESFVFFGNFGPNSRKIWSSAPRLLWEEKYYVVGNISVLRTPDETAQPVNIQTNAVDDDSDDDSTLQHHRLRKRHRRNKMQTDAQAEAVNVEECPEAGTEVEIVEVQAATQRMPFDLIQVLTPSHSSITPELSAATSISAGMRTSTSSSSTDISSTTPVSTSTSRQGYEIDPKYMLEPQDREFEVGPEFLLNDSQDTEATPEQGECTEEDVKKPLVEAKLSNPKEHVIDEYSACHDASSDDDFCIITEDTEHKKDPKFQEVVVGQEQGHQKPKRTYQYHHPLFGEKFAQLCGPRVKMTEVYDLNISRSFYGEQPSYPDIEEEHREQEQCEYEFSQCTGMLRNLKYERPGQQHTGQGQGPRVYHPGEQVVTVIDDMGSPTMEFFGNDNSQHSRNETHRCWEDPIDCAPPPLHHSSRSFQEMTGSHQTLAASFQASLLSCQASLVSCPASLPSCSASAPSCIVPVPIHKESVPICQVSAPISVAYAPIIQVYASTCQPSAQLCQALAASRQASGLLCQTSVVTHQVSAPRCQSLAVSHQASAPSRQASVVSQQVLAESYHQSAMSPHVSFDH